VAIRHLTFNNVANSDALRDAGGIPWMVTMLQAGSEHQAAADAAATLAQISADNLANQEAVREAGGIRPLTMLLSGNVDSQGLVWALRSLAQLAHNNTTNRNVICEQSGTIGRLVALLASGASSEGAREAAEVLRCLMAGHDDRIAVAVLAAMRRQGIGLGQDVTFALSDEFPELLQGLTNVVGSRLASAVKRGTDRGHIQMALNDAIALELPEEQLEVARARLDSIAAARAEAIAARKARRSKKDSKKTAEERAAAQDGGNTEKSEGATKEANASSNNDTITNPNDNDPQASAVPSAAAAILLAAQTRLHDLELAAAAAQRARRDAAKERASSGKLLTPSVRRAFSHKMGKIGASFRTPAARRSRESGEHEDSPFVSPVPLRPPERAA